MVFFLDTNVFLECKNLEDLDWKNAVGADDIRLVVPMTVVNELDKLKND
jgi:hypothetical protein